MPGIFATLEELDDNIWGNMEFMKYPVKTRKTLKEERREKRRQAKAKREEEEKKKREEEDDILNKDVDASNIEETQRYIDALRKKLGLDDEHKQEKEQKPKKTSRSQKISPKKTTATTTNVPKGRGRPPKQTVQTNGKVKGTKK